jgi:hypothetical protein
MGVIAQLEEVMVERDGKLKKASRPSLVGREVTQR